MEGKEHDTWRQADEIFGQLLELPGTARRARLEAMDLPDATHQRVLRMLAAMHDTGSSLLDYPERVTSMFQVDALSGRCLGRWQLGEEIGRGGMAVVYRATSTEGPEGQAAAVKVLTLGTLAGHGSRQFLREQQSLLRLRHPYIVPLLDAGVADDGTPWLAMGLVEGERVDTWCDRHGLDARAKVELVLQVCEALAHAHRNLVIHRDIKPSNVLVDEDGRVRLLDFGIAHAIDTSGESTATATAMRALTPGYASPEQRAGEAPTTGMDVYGLGALLHRLLTGKAPGRNARKAGGDDLAVVVQKALADPSDRYPSVEAFADDLGRWLDGKPVRARRPSVRYRLRKFVARNKLPVAAAGLVVVVLAGGVAATLWQAGLAHDAAERAVQAAEQHRLAQERAERALARSNAVRDFLFELFRNELPTGPRDEMPTTAELLSEAAASVDKRFPDNPQVRADFLSAIAVVYRERDLPGEVELWRKVLALREPDRENAPVDFAVAQSQLSRALLPDGLEESKALSDAAIASLQAHAPGSIELARSYERRATLEMWHNDGPARARAMESAWAIISRLEDVRPGERVRVAGNLATGYHSQGDYALAVDRYEDALESSREVNGEVYVTNAQLLGNRGGALSSLGRFAEAKADLELALAQYASIYDKPNSYVLAALRELELVAVRRGDYAAALAGRDRWDDAVRRMPVTPPLAKAKSAVWRAKTLALLGHGDQALALVSDGLAGLEADPETRERQAYNRLLAHNARLRASCGGDGAPVRDVDADVATVFKLAPGMHAMRRASALEGHALAGLCSLRAGDADEALVLFDKALAIATQVPPGHVALVAEIHAWQGDALTKAGRNAEARTAWRKGVEALRNAGLDAHPVLARLQSRLARGG